MPHHRICGTPSSACRKDPCGCYQLTLDMLTFAILFGGHIRVGLEDMIYLYPRKDELVKSNAQMVEKMVRIAEELGRPIATAAQTREMLGFKKGPQS